jgi:hypothetical protein
MTTCVIDPERFELVKDIPFSVSSHPLGPDGKPCEACVMEIINFIFGQGWTDKSKVVCPTVGAFLRRYNDGTDQDGRDRLRTWLFGEDLNDFTNAYRVVATAGDGHTQARGYLMADTAVRVFLPAWLDTAGATDAATKLRGGAQIVDRDTARAGAALARAARAAPPDYWECRRVLQEKLKAEIVERLKAHPAIAASAAIAAIDASAAIAASAASDASDASADGSSVYVTVKRAIREKITEILDAKRAEAGIKPVKESAIELLELMVAIG